MASKHKKTRPHAPAHQPIQIEHGSLKRSQPLYKYYRSHSPENAVALNNLGAALHALEKHEEGTAMLEKSMQLDPLNPGVFANLGIHYQEEGDLDRARAYYARQVT